MKITSDELFRRTQNVEIAKAEGEKIKKIGAAEAYTIEAVGRAEAERMRMKANVYKQYGEAAVMSLVLDALPKVRIHRIWMIEFLKIWLIYYCF